MTAARDRRTQAFRTSGDSRRSASRARDSNDSVALQLFPNARATSSTEGRRRSEPARSRRAAMVEATTAGQSAGHRDRQPRRERRVPPRALAAVALNAAEMIYELVTSNREEPREPQHCRSPSRARTSASRVHVLGEILSERPIPTRPRETGNGAPQRPSRRSSRGTHPTRPFRRSQAVRHHRSHSEIVPARSNPSTAAPKTFRSYPPVQVNQANVTTVTCQRAAQNTGHRRLTGQRRTGDRCPHAWMCRYARRGRANG